MKIIADELGYKLEELHTALKFKFLQINGIIPTARSTAKLSKLEFGDYIEQIRRFAAQELNIIIPDPDTVDYDTVEEWVR